MSNASGFLPFIVLALVFAGPVAAAGGNYEEGFEYLKVSPPQETSTTDQVEVVEMFWYGCPHCYSFEPYVEAWLKDKPANVKFVRMPAVFRPAWEVGARAYYVAEALGVLDKVHRPLLDAIHRDRRKLETPQAMRAFFAEHGVTPEDFEKTYNSFAVISKVKRAATMSRRYGVKGVPAVIVNGKYWTDAKHAGLGDHSGRHYEALLKVVDYLVDKESAQMAASSGASQ